MKIHLQLIPIEELRLLAGPQTGRPFARSFVDGALPPDFVARRALDNLAQGAAEFWCNTFYIVRTSDDCIVGACGFKHPPERARTDIGYGVAPSCRGHGVATAAVVELLRLAFDSGEVTEVLAEVNPNNTASTRLVERLHFERVGEETDDEGEHLVQWLARAPANSPTSNG